MHYSGMRAACLLTVFLPRFSAKGVLPRWSVCPGVVHAGVCLPGVCLPKGEVCFWSRGCIPACNGADTSLLCGQTDTCENITFANFVWDGKRS